MHLQTSVSFINAGFGTCDRCKKILVARLCIDRVDSNGCVESSKICFDCLNSGLEFQIGVEIKPAYSSAERKQTNIKAKKSEKKTAIETGGVNTGYFPNCGDSRNSRFMFEDKTRVGGDRKSFRITQEIILKGRSQARRAGRVPVFRIHLKDISV